MATDNCCEFVEDVLSRPVDPADKDKKPLSETKPVRPGSGGSISDIDEKSFKLATVILEVIRQRAYVEFPQSNRAAPSATVIVFPLETQQRQLFPYRAHWRFWQSVAVPTITEFKDKRFLPDDILIDKIFLSVQQRSKRA